MRDFFSFGAAAPSDAEIAANTLVGLSSSPLCLTQSLNFADPENRCLRYAPNVKPGQQRRLSKKFCANCQNGFQVPRNRVLKLRTRSEEPRPVGSGTGHPDNFYFLQYGNTFVRPVSHGNTNLERDDGELFIAKDDFHDGFFSRYETESENVSFKISDNRVLLGPKRSGGYTLSGRHAKRTLEQANEP